MAIKDLHINNHISEYLKKNHAKINTSRTNKITTTTREKITEEIMAAYPGTTREQIETAIALLCQMGGTARACDGNLSVTTGDVTFKLSEIRKAFQKAGCKHGLRKYARTHATEIFHICNELRKLGSTYHGNMYFKIKKLQDAPISEEESIWCSDFQAFNEDAPEKLKNYVISSFPKKKK